MLEHNEQIFNILYIILIYYNLSYQNHSFISINLIKSI